MPAKTVHELLIELESTLRAGEPIRDEDRALLARLHADLQAALAAKPAALPPHTLRENVREALGRVQADHPNLSNLLRATLDALSDLGV
jgi:hypothetical protein